MAPEQTRGDSRHVGAAADVYALGAILYECLTGRPPFRAATMHETLMQVATEDPVPPTQLQPKTPRDLETICLKCLQKEPPRRYGSAAALAEELGRFRRGEPIQARPVGRVERLAKWARRNPWVAGLAAALVAALTGGIAFTTHYALEASARARDAERKEGEASRARDEAEDALARGLLRPLGHNAAAPLNAIELEALGELASSKSERVRLRFLEQALEQQGTAVQLKNRMAPALVAAIGIEPKRRRRALEMVKSRLRDVTADLHTRWSCACLAEELAAEDPETLDLASSALLGVMGKSSESDDLKQPVAIVRRLSARLEPGKVTGLLLDAMDRRKGDSDALKALAEALSATAGRLEPAKAAGLLLHAMARTEDADARALLAGGLAEAAARLEGEQLPQGLIDFLKHPESTGLARERILFALGQRFPDRPGVIEADRRLDAALAVVGPCGGVAAQRQARAFTDLWECVAYLQKHHPEIDLASPPRRPGR
jgi:hypothetical protein